MTEMPMPTLEDILRRISRKFLEDGKKLQLPNIDVEYTYGQVQIDRDTSKNFVVSFISRKMSIF